MAALGAAPRCAGTWRPGRLRARPPNEAAACWRIGVDGGCVLVTGEPCCEACFKAVVSEALRPSGSSMLRSALLAIYFD